MTAMLRAGGEIRTDAVVEAFRAVPRHLFVPDVSLALAYADTVVPTKFDPGGDAISALSQPAIVAVMLEQLEAGSGMRVLEIGAGTGYNAALLAQLVGGDGRVVTVDVDEDVVEGARRHLAEAGAVMEASAQQEQEQEQEQERELGQQQERERERERELGQQQEQEREQRQQQELRRQHADVELVLGDGALGYEPAAPYDRIIATVAAADVPSAWLAQLAPDGKIVLPLRIRGGVTRSVVVEREPDSPNAPNARWRGSGLEVCSFMPLRGIADDPRREIDLARDGMVSVTVFAEQHAEPDLVRVLEYGGEERFTGVWFVEGESFSDLDIYLTCALPGGLSRLSVTGAAVESGIVRPQFRWGSVCTVDGDSLAYLTLRRSNDAEVLGDRWEVGVVGHGPRGAELADEVAAHVAEWDARMRGAEAVLHIAQGADRERLTGRFVVDKPAGRIAIDWV
jgi:protein-L-isoaspartate(D-aspartate) O-methyltransferase